MHPTNQKRKKNITIQMAMILFYEFLFLLRRHPNLITKIMGLIS